jgi:cob(I)alamin adenosyltransferase
MKIYTRAGDDGRTGTLGGSRVWKDSARIEAFGAVDELGAVLGLARAENGDPELDQLLSRLQHELFDLGVELATEPAKEGDRSVVSPLASQLEVWIDQYEAQLPQLKNFILAGGTRAAATLHLARVVCRRAERRVVALQRECELKQLPGISRSIVIYLNRLGDLLFVLSRLANARAGAQDVLWQRLEG